MVTPENSQRNVATARRNVMARLGITDTANLTYDLRRQYVRELAEEILKYPNSFTPETLARAQEIAAKDYGALQDDSFDFGAFIDAAADEAKVTLPSIGNKLLIAAAVVAGVYVGVRAWRSSGSPAPKLPTA